MGSRFCVTRKRYSITQDHAIVAMDGNTIETCEDSIAYLRPGVEFYGECRRGFASILPDEYFIQITRRIMEHRRSYVVHLHKRFGWPLRLDREGRRAELDGIDPKFDFYVKPRCRFSNGDVCDGGFRAVSIYDVRDVYSFL